MKKVFKKLLSLSLTVAIGLTVIFPMGGAKVVKAAPLPKEAYQWDNVRIGGGGAVPRLVLHPKVKDLAYIGTDVGGAYRWDKNANKWVAILDWIGRDQNYQYGVDAIAVDPSDITGNTLYAAVGKDSYNNVKGIVLKSTDRGDTWVESNLRVSVAANWEQTVGDRLGVDPNNSNIVYYASREGLFRSEDAGLHFSLVASAPTGNINNVSEQGSKGLRFIAFDENAYVQGVNDRTQTIYVGATRDTSANGLFKDLEGVFRSTDGGITWEYMAGSPDSIRRAKVDQSSGTLYVTGARGLWKYDPSTSAWTDITPVAGKTYTAIDIDPNNSNHIITSRHEWTHHLPVYRSTDGGQTWTEIVKPLLDGTNLVNLAEHPKVTSRINPTYQADVPWWPEIHFMSSTFAVAIDPFVANKVWYTDWYGAWITDDITKNPMHWYTQEAGHEEIVTVGGMACPPSGDAFMFSGVADNGGYAHVSLNQFPQETVRNRGLVEGFTVNGIDYQESNPNFMATVGTVNWNSPGGGYYSTDGGKTFTAFGSLPYSGVKGGRIAVSANGKTLLYLPQGSSPYYSFDNGTTWAMSNGAPSGSVAGGNIFNYEQPLAADRINSDIFYLYKSGSVYRTNNRGVNWSQVATGLPSQQKVMLEAAPGMEGEVWMSLDGNSGLYKSSDFGDTFTKVASVQNAKLFSFGKSAPGRLNPTVFVYGKINDEVGVFRSDDMGNTWVRIDIKTPTAGNDPNILKGDRQVFGRLFIGTNGTGIYYGMPSTPAAIDNQPPTSPSSLIHSNVGQTTVDLAWSASGDSDVMMYIIYNGNEEVFVSDGPACTVTGLTPGTQYSLKVKAVDTSYNLSNYSNEIQFTTIVDGGPPTTPANLQASSVKYNTITLKWDPSTDDVGLKNYEIYRGNEFLDISTSTSLTVSNLEPLNTYTFKVRAIDIANKTSEWSNILTVTTLRSPDKTALLVGNGSADNKLQQRLEEMGFIVDVKTDSAATAADATGKDLVLISATINSSRADKFKNVAVPVMICEPYGYDVMGMNSSDSDLSNTTTMTTLNIENQDHFLAGGLNSGVSVINTNVQINYSRVPQTAIKIATKPGVPADTAIFAYEKGATMYGANIAPERRVGFFLHDWTAAYLSNDGWKLFDASVNWLTGRTLTLNVDTQSGQSVTSPVYSITGNVSMPSYVTITTNSTVSETVYTSVYFSVPVTLSIGKNSIKVQADNYLGQKSDPVVLSLNLLDNVSPVIQLNQSDITVNNPQFTISGSVSETSQVTVKVNGTIVETVQNTVSFILSTMLAVGQNTIEIEAIDSSGNRSSRSITVTYSVPSGGSDNSDSSSSVTPSVLPIPTVIPTIIPTPEPLIADGKITMPIPDVQDGTAFVTVSIDTVTKAVDTIGQNSGRTLTIEIPGTASADKVVANLPAVALLAEETKQVERIDLISGLATLSFTPSTL